MARLRFAETDSNTVPTPPTGKSTMFLDSNDGSFKAKLSDGTIIPISTTTDFIQDTIGDLIQSSATIDFTYDSVGNTATFEVIQSALDVFQIPNTPVGNLTSNNVGDALNELQSDIDTQSTKLDTIETNAKDDQIASEVPYTPVGVLTQNNVQSAIDELEDILSNAQTIKVTKTPGTGQFSSVKNAVDSITDASPAKPYIIKVGLGVFAEDQITLKPNVSIAGGSKESTIITANNPNDDLLIGAGSVAVRDLTLSGVTGTNVSLVNFTATNSTDTLLSIYEVNFANFNKAVFVQSQSFNTFVDMNDIVISSDVAINKAFEVISSGTGTANLTVDGMRGLITNGLSHLFSISGSNTTMTISSAFFRSTEGTFVYAEDGAVASIQAIGIEGFDIGLHTPNIGAGPRIDLQGALRNITDDLLIESAFTTGSFIGAANNDKVTLDPETDFRVSFLDPINDGNIGQVIVGEIRQAARYDQLANISKLLRETATMGLLSGGEVSVVSGLDINVAAGVGFILDSTGGYVKEIEWDSINISLPASSSRYIIVNNNNIVTSSTSITDLKEIVVLARVITTSTGIDFIERAPSRLNHASNEIYQFLRSALGSIFASGSLVTENSVSARQLDVTAGEYWFATNVFKPSGGNNIEFIEHYRDGIGGFVSTPNIQTINNTKYDDGSGTLANLSAGFFAKHTLYLVGDGSDETYLQVYPQAQFATLAEAESASIPIPPTIFKDAVTLIASIIVEEGQANLIKILDERPVIGTQLSAVSASSNHSSLSGLSNDDHTQYLLTDGTRGMSGNLDMASNNIANVGTVDGVDVSAHKNRHLPNGADPLDTATAIEITDNTNAAGNANSFARSNHQHAHGNRSGGSLHAQVTTATNGFMSASDKIKLNTIETDAKDDQNANEVPYDNTISGLAATNVKTAIDEIDGRVDANETNISNLQTNKQDISEKGQANGYASLDANARIPSAQLPLKLMEFEGNWNASTNTPTLDNTDTEKQGTTYRVSVSGTIDFGAGPISFDVGDWVYNDGDIWDRGDNVDQVTSVFGRLGNVTAQSGDYTASQIDYERADGSKVDIQAASDDVESSLNNLDDRKLSRSGSQAMTGNLDMGTNNVTNVGTVDGVDVSNHASRHLPSGADPLATGVASTINADTANTEGNAESFSRSNHTHQIPTANVGNTGTANAQGVSPSLSRADHIHDTVITRFHVASTTTQNIVAGPVTVVNDTTVTPNVAGTYMVMFEGLYDANANNNQSSTYQMYLNGTALAPTLRSGHRLDVDSAVHANINHVQAFNGTTDTIDVRASNDSGSINFFGRSITLIRLGP